MKNEMNHQNNTPEQHKGYKYSAWIFGLLFAGACATTFWFLNERNSAQNESLALTDKIETLNGEQTQLQSSLADLKVDYDGQIAVNDTLQVDLDAKLKELEGLQWRVQKAKKQLLESQANADQIKGRLAQLEELRNSLEQDMANLQLENGALKDTNGILSNLLIERESRIGELNNQVAIMMVENDKLQDRLYTVAPAGFKADNFSIRAEQRNDKLTAKAKRTEEIKVTFDIDNVPQEFQGKRDLYLVLTEFTGEAVAQVPSKDMSVRASDTPFNVSAADIETVQLKNRQSVSMSFKPTDDLEPGNYNVLVYADNGFLGSTGLQLR